MYYVRLVQRCFILIIIAVESHSQGLSAAEEGQVACGSCFLIKSNLN